MQQQVLKISRSQVGSLIQRLGNSAEYDTCLIEVKRMLAIKQRIALESEVRCWATSPEVIREMANRIEVEIKLLHKTVNVLEEEDRIEAVTLLEEYINLLP